ncbi:MAG: response regulator [Proteobacteria bacterium]|nr:response regulator [Pseudomonadota bacterium]MBU1058172.1 response regulator [Pseudomonadota bacterium]
MSSFCFLLVDDEQEFVETVALRLRQRGFEAACAFSGTEALNWLGKNDTVDVVVLDIGMPDPDGMKVIEILKEKYPLVEVIMLTGQATIQSAIEAMKLGAFAYLMKPCKLNDLLSKAEEAAARKKEREAKILDARMKPYISKRERDELISHILESKE